MRKGKSTIQVTAKLLNQVISAYLREPSPTRSHAGHCPPKFCFAQKISHYIYVDIHVIQTRHSQQILQILGVSPLIVTPTCNTTASCIKNKLTSLFKKLYL